MKDIKSDTRGDIKGTHYYTRGPQVILNEKGDVVGYARTLTHARRIRKPGESIKAVSAMVWP